MYVSHTHMQRFCQVALYDLHDWDQQVLIHQLIIKELAAEEVLARRSVDQQLVHVPALASSA